MTGPNYVDFAKRFGKLAWMWDNSLVAEESVRTVLENSVAQFSQVDGLYPRWPYVVQLSQHVVGFDSSLRQGPTALKTLAVQTALAVMAEVARLDLYDVTWSAGAVGDGVVALQDVCDASVADAAKFDVDEGNGIAHFVGECGAVDLLTDEVADYLDVVYCVPEVV